MKLTENQKWCIRVVFEDLFRRAKEIEPEWSEDYVFDKLFHIIDLDPCRIRFDRQIGHSYAVIAGLTRGLGLEHDRDLYEFYKLGLDAAVLPDPPDVLALADAADQALRVLAERRDPEARPIVDTLGQALASLRGKRWT